MTTTYLAVDLGGTNVKYGLVSAEGTILERRRAPVQALRGPDPIIRELIGLLLQLLDDLSLRQNPLGLTVGAAGLIRPREGILVFAPNLPGWREVPLAHILEDALGIPVKLENDANLFTLGEWLAGAGRGLNNLVGVTLGTGVGGGLILNGKLWHGAFGTAGEIGHMVIDSEGYACGCGGRGCLETLASATAITRMAKELLAQGCLCRYGENPDGLDAEILFQLASQGDELAREVFQRAGKALGLALTSIFNLLSLEGVVIGGGAARAYPHFYPSLRDEFFSRVLAVDPEKIVISRTFLGDDAPLAGAPALFIDD